MSTYDLNDNVEDSFSFILGGFTYNMRYPTVEELENVQTALKKAQEDEDTKTIMDQMYQFISPVDKDAPSISETMKKQNLPVIKKFNEMIKTEFGA